MSLSLKAAILIGVTIYPFLGGVSSAQTWVKIPTHFSTGDTAFPGGGWNATFVSNSTGWFVTATYPGDIFRTTDGGYHWMLQKQVGIFFQLFALDSLHVWMRRYHKGIVFSNDGGASWDSSFVDTAFYFSGGPMFFFDKQNGLMFGSNLFATSDGGKTWESDSSKDSLLIQSALVVDFVCRRQGFIGGPNPTATDAGFIGGTTDSGKTWNYFTTPQVIEPITGIDFPDSLTGFAVGYGAFGGEGTIRSTKDGGKHWAIQYISGGGIFYDVGFLDTLRGWITGPAGRVWHTTDGGANWNMQQTPVVVDLRKISVLHTEKVAYVFGDSNTVLRADLTTGVEVISSRLPSVSTLYQNYPNPFNSETIIEYVLEKQTNVRLDIFDLLGQKMRTLVDKTEFPGIHRARWNASDDNGRTVASGIYICRLTAGNYISHKEIIFLK